MKPASKLGLRLRISGKRISVSGDIPEHMAKGFMHFVCVWESTNREVSWEQVKAFGAPVEARWVDTRVWLNIPIPRRALQDILTTSSPSVIVKLLSLEKGKRQAQPILRSLSLEEAVRLIKKLRHRSEVEDLIKAINREHLPVLLTMGELGTHVLECVTKALKGN